MTLGPVNTKSFFGGKETPLASAQGVFPSPPAPLSFPQRVFFRLMRHCGDMHPFPVPAMNAKE